MMPFSDPRFPGDAKASHFQLILRRRSDGKQSEVAPDIQEELTQIIAYLQGLREADQLSDSPPVPPPSRTDDVKDAGPLPTPAPNPKLTLPKERDVVAKRLKLTRVRLGSRLADSPPLTEEELLQNLALLTDSSLLADDTTLVEPKAEEPAPAAPPILTLPAAPASPPSSTQAPDTPAPPLLTLPAEATPPPPPATRPIPPNALKLALLSPPRPALFAAPIPAALPTAPGNRAKWLSVLAAVLCLAVLGGVAFFQLRPTARTVESGPSAASPTEEETISAEASRTAELALRAVHGGRLEEASGVLADARKHGVVLPGLRYQAALLAMRQGDGRAGTEWIAQSIAAHEFVPECLYLRANAAGTAGDYAAVCSLFEEAAGHAAFSPRYFFFWGEALRRVGHSAQALPPFERALLSRPNSTDTDLIRFKMGLAQIEAGIDEKFEAYLRSLLAQKPVSGDALLLAAAVEINRAAYPAAAEYLQRAKEAMPPAVLSGRLRDFLFQAQAHQPDLAAAWPKITPTGPAVPPPSTEPAAPPRPRVAVVIDPATRSLAEADPATW